MRKKNNNNYSSCITYIIILFVGLSSLLKFAKENIVMTGIILVGIISLVLFIIYFIKQSSMYKTKNKQNTKFNENIEYSDKNMNVKNKQKHNTVRKLDI